MGFFGSGKKPADQTGPHRTVAGYGIDDAIRLMRTLPADQNPQLVVRVVKNTLESVHVHLADIIQDASTKQKALRERSAGLNQQITELESEITKRRDEIFRIEADLDETTNVKERLELVEAADRDAAGAPTKPDESTPVALNRTSPAKVG